MKKLWKTNKRLVEIEALEMWFTKSEIDVFHNSLK